MDAQREQSEKQNQNQTDKVVSGFAFYSEKDAKLAEQERQKIAYLDKRIDRSDPESVLVIYKKALEERVFRTPVGLEYLRELQMELQSAKCIGKANHPAADRLSPVRPTECFFLCSGSIDCIALACPFGSSPSKVLPSDCQPHQ